jgi:hypothetical protein
MKPTALLIASLAPSQGFFFDHNAAFHFFPEGGHEGNEQGYGYYKFTEGKWETLKIELDDVSEFPIYELYMELPYSLKCNFYMNGLLITYPEKTICGNTDIFKLDENPLFAERPNNSVVTVTCKYDTTL